MKALIKKILNEETLLNESGIRGIKELAKRYPKAKIYFHQDLDGVTTALGMKNYLEQHGIKVVDAEVIQYGEKEFAIKKPEASGDVMPVLVDFAHGKPMFEIHTDHHDSQAGTEDTKSTSFRHSRSNVETISLIVSPKEIFPSDDITLISTVDSADFVKYDITPEMVMNYLFRFDKDESLKSNKMKMGLVVNKLLLAYKNKPGFLERLVLNSQPSLLSILNNIKKEVVEKGYARPEMMKKNQEDYVKTMKTHPDVKVEDNVIVQYGGGSMMKPGSYDRYTPFKNNPEADFIVIAWPLGLVQSSCNPFKKERALKGVNLKDIADEVLSKWESQLKEKYVPLSTIKWVSESGKEFNKESVGFTFKDFKALYGKVVQVEDIKVSKSEMSEIMDKPFKELTESEMEILDNIKINVWELIQANSGGHKCITNISGLNYIARSARPPKGNYRYDAEKEDAPYIKFVKMIQKEFVRVLKEKINQGNTLEPMDKELGEEWSEKYKKSIDCNNPKGFSQKAHCQGRKKRDLDEYGRTLKMARRQGVGIRFPKSAIKANPSRFRNYTREMNEESSKSFRRFFGVKNRREKESEMFGDNNLKENILKEETSLQSKLLNLIDTEGLIKTTQRVNGIETLGKVLKEKPEILLTKYLGRETFSTDDIRENTGGYNFIFKLVRVTKNEDGDYYFYYSIEEGTVELIMVDNSIHNLLDGASSFDGDTWWEIKYEINDILRDFTKELYKKIKLPFEKTTTGFVLGD